MTTTLLTGIMTNAGRAAIAKSFGNLKGASGQFPICRAKYFKIGMGGYTIVGASKFPKDPDPALTNIEATGAPGDFYYQKELTALDVTFIAPSTIQIRCHLVPAESNDDGTGNAPRFFEVGLFDENNTMVCYATFGEQTKSANKVLTNFLQVYF